MLSREKFEEYFNEKVINHDRRKEILNRIRETRSSRSYNRNGLKGLIRHFVGVGVLRPTQNGSHFVDYNILNSYFMGEMGLVMWVAQADPEYKKDFAGKLKHFLRSGGTNIDFVCEPFVRTFSEFSPDIVVYTGYDEDMGEELAKRLRKATGKKIRDEYLAEKYEFGKLPQRKSNGVIIYELNGRVNFKRKNVLILDRLMDPFTIIGMAEAVQEQGAKVMGVAGLFATQSYDPQYALPAAKINLDGWKESTGSPFSPGFGKFAFYFPVETAHLEKRYKLQQDR